MIPSARQTLGVRFALNELGTSFYRSHSSKSVWDRVWFAQAHPKCTCFKLNLGLVGSIVGEAIRPFFSNASKLSFAMVCNCPCSVETLSNRIRSRLLGHGLQGVTLLPPNTAN
jgi:hypothetical protein